MIKIIPENSWSFNDKAVDIIKYSSFGLKGNDLKSFIKRAGLELANEIKNINFSPNEIPIHAIAMGATEVSGPNRNADGFTAKALEKYASTFETIGKRFCRDHKNKPSDPHFGLVKKAFYNKDQGRVELIIGLFGSQKLAEENNGKLADKEMEKLASDKDLSVSMSCKVAYDVCSSCKNKAATRDDYCTDATCSHGGLQKNAGKIFEDGMILHADNPHPTFIEISHVFRPADRIAYVMGKIASDKVVTGAELAEMYDIYSPIELEYDSFDRSLKDKIKIATDLLNSKYAPSNLDLIFTSYKLPELPNNISSYERSLLLKSLALEKVALPLKDWLYVTTGEPYSSCIKVANEVSQYLPSIMTVLQDTNDFNQAINLNKFVDNTPSQALRSWVIKNAKEISLEESKIQKRIWMATIKGNKVAEKGKLLIKTANDIGEPKYNLGRQYFGYVVNFLSQHSIDNNYSLIKNAIVSLINNC